MAGEKNSKYKKEYCQLLNSEIMTIQDAKAIGKGRQGVSCVYCFFDGDTPVYVGKTINSKRRFETYTGARSHNYALNEFIKANKNKPIIRILPLPKDQISQVETAFIKSEFDTLFNISNNKAPNWVMQTKINKPWIAGCGIKCPSQIAMQSVKSPADKEKISKIIKGMSDIQRCLFEIETAMELSIRNGVNKWLDIVSPKMIEFMESQNG